MQKPSPQPSAPATLGASDKTVLIYGAIAALAGLILYALMAARAWPWGHPFVLAFWLQWVALAPLAGALLAGMRGSRRWLAALAAYGLILPAMMAYGLTSANGSLPNEPGGWPQGNDLALALLLTGAAGFILLPLIQALDARKPQWGYPAVFRAAWRNAVHLTLAACLASAVCLLLTAAGAMFTMIGIKAVRVLVDNAYFRLAVWPMVLAACLVGVRRRPQLTDTLQRSWLTLNAWLLPLVTLVGLAFTLALAARMALGLQAVQLSAGALIAFSLAWIKLINAAWQDSPEAAPFGPRLRMLLRAAMVCLLPLAAVALYGAVVRVEQYGWTVLRVWGVVSSMVLMLYGAGYAWAALRPKHDYLALGATNLVAAFASLGLLIAVNTPVANPLRLTAESQLRRLVDGRLDPERFSFYAMGREYGHWGRDALQQLADGAASARDPRIALAAAEALKGSYFGWNDVKPAAQETPAAGPAPVAAPAFATTPAGRAIPESWWNALRASSPSQAATCATPAAPATPDATASLPCRLIFADLTGDGQDEIVLYVAPRSNASSTGELLIAYASDGQAWSQLGWLRPESFEQPMEDATGVVDIRQALEQGLVRTQPRPERDLMIGDNLLRLR
ncbi:DUF4153 domain-containing protein [Achromobacter sp. UMC46]|uniref:DUF4153 domain-containing protein n=1 Tax=Achromobacter sp. UMC46 TaxID=1862319 RepID=UPI0016005420|nr:DUF4153 domain-containing protein [Achromobacter sp. UMC46]MBB1597003.1 DUF4153 domain-containing protein [Achromobacter sp. UMC46]